MYKTFYLPTVLLNGVYLFCHQEDDVALPEIPNEPIPHVPKSAELERGTITVVIYLNNKKEDIFKINCVYLIVFVFVLQREKKQRVSPTERCWPPDSFFVC